MSATQWALSHGLLWSPVSLEYPNGNNSDAFQLLSYQMGLQSENVFFMVLWDFLIAISEENLTQQY